MTKTQRVASGRRKTGKTASPKKGKADGKLHPLSMRTTLEVRKRLEEAAAKNGRSMAAEVEERLLGSFTRERRESEISAEAAGGVYASFGPLETFTLMRLLATVISFIELKSNEAWDKNPETFDQVKEACATILEIARPKPGSQGLRALAARGFVSNEAVHVGAETAKQVYKEWLERSELADELMRPAANEGT